MGTLAAQILAALPQTQCTRCAYPDCEAYAQAIEKGAAGINQCPPGGAEGIARLALITGLPLTVLNPAHGIETPRTVAFIDENWCIGCTLCIKACPTDAILGSNKLMHTVIEPYCTGCELCLPVCPVDCIKLDTVTGEATGWNAWSAGLAEQARERYEASRSRSLREAAENEQRLQALAQMKLADLASHSQITDPMVLDKKRAAIETALTAARARRSGC